VQGQGPSNINLNLFGFFSLMLTGLPNHISLLTMVEPNDREKNISYTVFSSTYTYTPLRY